MDADAHVSRAGVDEGEGIIDDLPEGEDLDGAEAASGAGELEELVEEAVHLVGGLGDAFDVGAEALGVSGEGVLLDETEESADGDEGGLEVVRDGVGEAFEFGVSELELVDEGVSLDEAFLDGVCLRADASSEGEGPEEGGEDEDAEDGEGVACALGVPEGGRSEDVDVGGGAQRDAFGCGELDDDTGDADEGAGVEAVDHGPGSVGVEDGGEDGVVGGDEDGRTSGSADDVEDRAFDANEVGVVLSGEQVECGHVDGGGGSGSVFDAEGGVVESGSEGVGDGESDDIEDVPRSGGEQEGGAHDDGAGVVAEEDDAGSLEQDRAADVEPVSPGLGRTGTEEAAHSGHRQRERIQHPPLQNGQVREP